jgi:uncharacterized phage-associated protein
MGSRGQRWLRHGVLWGMKRITVPCIIRRAGSKFVAEGLRVFCRKAGKGEKSTVIEFQFKPEKMASAIAYIAAKVPGVTKKQICKLLYFADRDHLLKYGRTITGDDYHALPQGHVPTRGLNMMDGTTWTNVNKTDVDLLRSYGHLDHWVFVLERDPDLKVFSKSDREILDSVIVEMGTLTAEQLEELSHAEPSWKKTRHAARIDFDLFFEGHPEAEPIREALLEEAEPLTLVAG